MPENNDENTVHVPSPKTECNATSSRRTAKSMLAAIAMKFLMRMKNNNNKSQSTTSEFFKWKLFENDGMATAIWICMHIHDTVFMFVEREAKIHCKCYRKTSSRREHQRRWRGRTLGHSRPMFRLSGTLTMSNWRLLPMVRSLHFFSENKTLSSPRIAIESSSLHAWQYQFHFSPLNARPPTNEVLWSLIFFHPHFSRFASLFIFIVAALLVKLKKKLLIF